MSTEGVANIHPPCYRTIIKPVIYATLSLIMDTVVTLWSTIASRALALSYITTLSPTTTLHTTYLSFREKGEREERKKKPHREQKNTNRKEFTAKGRPKDN